MCPVSPPRVPPCPVPVSPLPPPVPWPRLTAPGPRRTASAGTDTRTSFWGCRDRGVGVALGPCPPPCPHVPPPVSPCHPLCPRPPPVSPPVSPCPSTPRCVPPCVSPCPPRVPPVSPPAPCPSGTPPPSIRAPFWGENSALRDFRCLGGTPPGPGPAPGTPGGGGGGARGGGGGGGGTGRGRKCVTAASGLRTLQDGGAGVEVCRAAVPAGSARPRLPRATRCPDGHDGQGGDGSLLGEEHQVQPAPVPSRHHLQVVPAHGDVHHPSWHRRRAQLRRLPLQPGCPAAPGAVSPLPGRGEVAQPGPCSHLLREIRPGFSPLLPHLEWDPAPGVGPGEGLQAQPGAAVRGAGPGLDPALLGGPRGPVKAPPARRLPLFGSFVPSWPTGGCTRRGRRGGGTELEAFGGRGGLPLLTNLVDG